jgi:hypothetical protein
MFGVIKWPDAAIVKREGDRFVMTTSCSKPIADQPVMRPSQ